ncbi:MAG: ABC transporter permease [Chitinophagaceae bacterium]|nr:ABC transporter permease [Chitinophagaceae bacterium]
MNKIGLIIEREYMTRVKRKSFLLTTIIVPIVIIAFYAVIIAVSISGESNTQRIAVLDEANLFNGKIETPAKDKSSYFFIHDETEQSFKTKYKDEGYTLFLYIPHSYNKDSGQIKIHSQAAVSIFVKADIEKKINEAVEKKRLLAANIDPDIYKKIKADIEVENTIDSGKGEQRGIAGVAYAISFIAGILIYMILLIYGTMVMRGVMEEKTNRIAEVIVSSAKPFQLMLGKIIGIGAVGITQFAIWIVLMSILQLIIPFIFPDFFQQISNPAVMSNPGMQQVNPGKMVTIIQGLHSLPIAKMVLCFIFYFIGGYLLYAALFAAIGSVVSEDQNEAQQLVFPVMMPLILGFVIMTKAVNDPDSGLAVFGSLFPLTSPIVMMGRITFGVPAWQLALSMALLVLGFLFFTWLTAKIYRTGILLYGKKITWKEMWKWLVRKS